MGKKNLKGFDRTLTTLHLKRMKINDRRKKLPRLLRIRMTVNAIRQKNALRKRQLAIGMPAEDQVQVVQRTMPTQFHQNKNQGMRVEKSRLINATIHHVVLKLKG